MAPNGVQMPGKSLSKDLFEDMGRKVENMTGGGNSAEGDSEPKVVEEIESLCMNCHASGTTRLLLTKIPFFREIVLMSFSCEECGFKNSEIQSAGEIQQRGARYTFKVENEHDMARQVVKTDYSVFKVEDVDLEIPAGRGQLTNIEGLLSAVKADLFQHQDARMQQMPEVGIKVGEVIQALDDMLSGKRFPFTVSSEDISGNSFIEPSPHDSTGKWKRSDFDRTPQQNGTLGLGDDVPAPAGTETGAPPPTLRPEYHASNLVGGTMGEPRTISTNNVDDEDDEIHEGEVYSFPSSCPGCTRPCATNMKMVHIPFFKQVVLMSTACAQCGYRSNEVKTGGEVPARGRKITLRVENPADLARDVLKSESAALSCPELDLHVQPGTLGGRFTTVEGLLTQFRKDLRAQAFGLSDGDSEAELAHVGDSVEPTTKRSWDDFFAALTDAIEGKTKFTVVIQDPLASSYVQSFTAPEPDPQIHAEDYDRTEEEEEDLGLRDIQTEGYEGDPNLPASASASARSS
ncbi:hypothetical protein AAFC00_001894 [Neodothiora populina]|uniref:Zinc finger ZPR1-type domain-containing protein n=1 Tax=Neodothiora populina TaxID=2781224 RepID=A0ABR3PQN9_9PEZI